MWQIKGTIIDYTQFFIGGPYCKSETEELIATFDKEKDAINYIKKSKLKTPKKQSFDYIKPFKKKSLLCNCSSAYIEEYIEPEIPTHNPKI